ncbi:uncharacterized protein LOC129768996 isoform X2 [Toxorhynchites rutilus septentrionalis]|nr:uncharacterized protein LOC129768996 isoform X2 [Toxorhynchites rutilus septentrionalis]XP_055626950.1 uncharacterized protein LOC129768996 isoform X2 [Toxorhynchites rutilus septentrionalis]
MMSNPSNSGPKVGCAGCTIPEDAENMVQCDACDTWWHFSCAGVADSIADRAWICIRCKPHSRASSRASVASRSSSHLTDSMARLRERQELEKQRAEIGLEKKFLKEQKELLEVSIAAEEERRSRVSRVSRADSIGRVNDWIENSANPQSSAAGGNQMPAASEIQQHNLQSTDLNSDATVGGIVEEFPLAAPSDVNIPHHSSPLRDRTIPTFDTTEDLSHLLVPTIEDNVDRRETMNLVRDLRARLEQCLAQSEPTVPHMTHLQRQLELCRMAMEAMHSTVHRLSIMPPTGGLTTEGTTGEDGLPRQSAKSLGVPSPSVLPSNPNPNVSPGKCHASENQTDQAKESNISQSILCPTMQTPRNEQQRLAHAHSNIIKNHTILQKQTSQCTPSSFVSTQLPPIPESSEKQLAMQQPTMPSMTPPSVQSSVMQPSVQQPTLPSLAQQSSTQSLVPPLQQISLQNPQMQCLRVQFPPMPQNSTQHQSSQHLPVMQVPRQPASVQKIPAQQLPVQSTPWQPYQVQRSPVQYPHVQQPPAQYPQVQCHPMMQYSVQDLPMRQSHIQQPPMQQHPLYSLPIQQPPAQYPQTQQSTIQPEAQFAPMQQSTYQSPLQPLQAQTPPTQQFLMQQPSTNNPPSSWEEPPPDWNQDEGESIPTPRQLTSRQSLARDLPTFSGDPAEWPIFISNFEYTTTTCGYTHGENMVRLQRCLRGRALESVRSRLVFPAAVPQVIETLRMRYGRPELLINALLQKVRAMPAPRGDKLEALIEYGMVVQELCDHIEAANERAHLTNPTLLQELVGKLPADQKLMWAGYKRGCDVVDLKTFSDYMTGVMQDASSVVLYESDPQKNTAREKSKVYVNSHKADETATTTTTQLKTSRCLHCEKEGHKIRECQAFRALSIDDRWRRVRALTLCQICLYGHGRRACRISSKCNVNGCQFKHHPLLHGKATTPVTQLANINTHRPQDSGVLFRILPVTLYGYGFAFLDEGSSLTLVEDGLVAQLGIAGDSQPLCLRWTGNTSRVEKNSKTVTITVSGLDHSVVTN